MPHSPPPSRRPRGRPRIFDETRRQTLCTLIAVGLSRNEAARQVGVKPSSIVYAAQTDPAFAQRLTVAQFQRKPSPRLSRRRPPRVARHGSPARSPLARTLPPPSLQVRAVAGRPALYACRPPHRPQAAEKAPGHRSPSPFGSQTRRGERGLGRGHWEFGVDHIEWFPARLLFRKPPVAARTTRNKNNIPVRRPDYCFKTPHASFVSPSTKTIIARKIPWSRHRPACRGGAMFPNQK